MSNDNPRPTHLVAGWWPGKLYYGWVILLALAFGQITSWGILYYGFSVFVGPMQTDLGWSRAALTGGFSLALLASGIAGLVVGRWLDRHGPRLLMTVGSIAAALLLVAWSGVNSLPAFYAIFIGLGITMAMVHYEPAFAAVATWFVRGRSRALTILTFVAGFASVIYIPLIARLVEAYGWRTALVALGILLALLTIPPHALILRRRPEDLGLLPDGARAPTDATSPAAPVEESIPTATAIRSTSFRWLTIGFCLAFFANVAATVHLIPYLTDHGFSPGFAAGAAGAIGLLALPGRVIFTPLGGRVSRRFVAASIFAIQAVALVVLVAIPSTIGVAGFVVLFGLGFGAITPARAGLVADLYGRANYGSISGVLALFVTGARSLAPVAAGLLYGAFSGYGPVFWLLVVIAALAAAAVLLIPDERKVERMALAKA
jgi:MFS family permease